MMSIGRSSRRENLCSRHGYRAQSTDQDPLANHIRASSREWLHQQAIHMTATDPQSSRCQKVLDRKAPSTHDDTP
jgi:hypothetical protein